MDELERLLQVQGSELSRASRASLSGLCAALRSALQLIPSSDPANSACKSFVTRLDRLLKNPQISGSAEPSVQPNSAAEPADSLPAGPVATSWPGLLEIWSQTVEWQTILGKPEIAVGDSQLAQRLYALLWRLPPATVEQWRKQWLARAGIPEHTEAPEIVAGPMDECVIAPSELRPGEVRFALAGSLDQRLGDQELGEISRQLAAIVTACLWFAEHDPNLRHMVRGVFRFGSTTLAGAQRSRYEKALLDRFDRFRQAEIENQAAELVTAWVELDEAINSLVHQPIAHRQSLFAQLGRAGRETLSAVRDRAVAAGVSVHVQILSGKYADIRGFTDADADVESPVGNPGEIVHCSRVFYRLNGTATMGRVVYRPR